VRPLEVAVALIQREGRLFLQRRDRRTPRLPGCWELPGGKLEGAESAEQALLRELEEELRWTPEEAVPLAPFTFAYPDRPVRLHPFRCTGSGPLHCTLAWGWFRSGEVRRLSLPAATLALFDALGE
jgi:mutator protein MutT